MSVRGATLHFAKPRSAKIHVRSWFIHFCKFNIC